MERTKKMKKIAAATLAGLFAMAVAMIFALNISYNNKQKMYHTLYEAEVQNIETRLDNMWNIIADKFSMNRQYAEDFKEMAKINVNAFQSNGEVFRWVHTQMPQVDPSLYREVMTTIEAERLSFERSQKKIIDVVREHNYLIVSVPAAWFISDKTPLEWQVISSTETKEIMKSRTDNRSLEDLRKK